MTEQIYQHSLQVENIKCGGCANQITTQLSQLENLTQIDVDYEQGVVSWQSNTSEQDAVIARLTQMGYPPIGTVSGLGAAGAKAKSYVSCALGKLK